MSSKPEDMDLAGWLNALETRNRDAIVLGLDRVAQVARNLHLQADFPVITVGGTNGKGSVCAYLEAMLMAAGIKVGCYTSPHLLRYNERVRIAGEEATDAALSHALATVESARGDIPLTYFEQGTLAAMHLFRQATVEVAILEVGLGGRLDAVNIWDADCAIVASVDLDHQSFLGDTREAIGREKAGILRPGRPAICGDEAPPESLVRHAKEIGAILMQVGREITLEEQGASWTLRLPDVAFPALPRPTMVGRHQLINAACAVAALHQLRERLPISRQAIRQGLAQARQAGRFQVVGHQPLRILDVAHNPHAARALAANLEGLLRAAPPGAKLQGVLGILADKDVAGVIAPMLPLVSHWHVAGLAGPRGLSGEGLGVYLEEAGASHTVYPSLGEAWQSACREAGSADTICAFGSFYTVAELMAEIQAVPLNHG